MNTKLVIISKIAWVPCVSVVVKQKQPVTFSCVANFLQKKEKFHDNIYRIDALIKNLNEESLIDLLVYVLDKYNDSTNKQILLHTICYIQSTRRFEKPSIDQC